MRPETSSPLETAADPAGPTGADARRSRADQLGGVRASDLMPYTGLRYLSTLFRIMAVILLVVLAAEAVAGFASQGTASLPTVLGEASRLIVLAGVLWGAGDLAILLIDMGHDVRATRIFLNRQMTHAHPDDLSPTREQPRDAARDLAHEPLDADADGATVHGGRLERELVRRESGRRELPPEVAP